MLADETRSFITGRERTMAVATLIIAPAYWMPTAAAMLPEMQRAQLLMIAGFVMLGWVLIRRQIAMRKRVNRDTREATQALRAIRESTQPAIPLSDAPVETQRWQIAMFDLQRELKAELDTRIAIVNTLVRQADQRIARLEQMETTASTRAVTVQASPQATVQAPLTSHQSTQLRQLLAEGNSAAEIATAMGLPIGDVEFAISMTSLRPNR